MWQLDLVPKKKLAKEQNEDVKNWKSYTFELSIVVKLWWSWLGSQLTYVTLFSMFICLTIFPNFHGKVSLKLTSFGGMRHALFGSAMEIMSGPVTPWLSLRTVSEVLDCLVRCCDLREKLQWNNAKCQRTTFTTILWCAALDLEILFFIFIFTLLGCQPLKCTPIRECGNDMKWWHHYFLGTSRWREVKRWRQQGVEDIDVSNIDPSTGRQKQDLATHFGPPPTGRTTTGCLTAQPASLYVDPVAPAKSSTLVTGVALSAQGKPAMISSPFQQDQSVVHQGLVSLFDGWGWMIAEEIASHRLRSCHLGVMQSQFFLVYDVRCVGADANISSAAVEPEGDLQLCWGRMLRMGLSFVLFMNYSICSSNCLMRKWRFPAWNLGTIF